MGILHKPYTTEVRGQGATLIFIVIQVTVDHVHGKITDLLASCRKGLYFQHIQHAQRRYDDLDAVIKFYYYSTT